MTRRWALKVTETTRDEFGVVGKQTMRWLNGLGLIRRKQELAAGGLWDVVDTQYDKVGRLWLQSRPFREGDAIAEGYAFTREEGHVYPSPRSGMMPLMLFWHSGRQDNFTTAPLQWSKTAYDGLGRVTMQRAPDGSEVHTFYNEGTRPGYTADVGRGGATCSPMIRGYAEAVR